MAALRWLFAASLLDAAVLSYVLDLTRDILALGLLAAIIHTFHLMMATWLGLAKTSFHHAPQSLTLSTKSGEIISFSDLCKNVMPPCRLNPFLFNGHLQTMWTALKGQDVPVYYKRKIFENQDPVYTGTFAVDFAVKPYHEADASLPKRTTYYSDEEVMEIGSDDTRPMLVTLHGLSGGSYELYLRHVLSLLLEQGWEACVVNSRGCARSKITSSVLYNARATWDTKQTVEWLRETFPNRPLFGIGFSLGANILTNYIGEQGSDCALKAAIAVSNPWNLEASSLALQRTFMGLNVYSRAMGTNMKALIETHIDQISQNPKINLDAVRNIKYLHEFDREVQCPTWGYPTEGAYYRDAASTDSLLSIQIPFLAIHAEDDPIAANEALPRQEVKQTPYAVLCTTELGGHLSWFELGGGRWHARAAAAFFQKMVDDIDLDHRPTQNGDLELKGHLSREQREPLKPVFEPMRRKLDFPSRS